MKYNWNEQQHQSLAGQTPFERMQEAGDQPLDTTLALFSLLLDAAPIGFAFLDTNLRFRLVNSLLAEMNKLPPEHLLGSTFNEALPAWGKIFEPLFEQVLRSGEPLLGHEISSQTLNASGEPSYWLVNYYPVHATDGQLLGIGMIIVDIARRKQAELSSTLLAAVGRALAESLDEVRVIQQVAGLLIPTLADLCVFELSERGHLRFRQVAVAHRDPACEPLLHALHCYPADPRGSLPASFEPLRRGEPALIQTISDDDLRIIATDEEHLALMRKIEAHSALLLPLRARGRVLGVLTLAMTSDQRQFSPDCCELAREIAARCALAIDNMRLYSEEQEAVENEQAARAATERYADQIGRLQQITAAFAGAMTPAQIGAVVITECLQALDAQAGGLVCLNKHQELEVLCAIGFSEELVACTNHRFATATTPVYDVINTAVPVLIESFEEWYSCYPELAPLMVEHGYPTLVALPLLIEQRVVGAILFYFAAPHRLSTSILAFMAAVSQQCAQALERARLYEAERQARTLAESAVSMRDTFFSIAAHELRTPLTSLMGQAQLLQRRLHRQGNNEPRNLHAVQVILDQARRLTRMMTAMLDVSRLEHNGLVLEHTQLDLGALVMRVIEETQPTLEHHRIYYNPPDKPLLIVGDELRLEQVFQNLIHNAVKYSPHSDTVTVNAAQHAGRASVSITDQGIGIPEEARSQLFQRFYRAKNADAQRISGIGIGLFVVKKLVELHGGEVLVESTEGVGSTFTVVLPLKT